MAQLPEIHFHNPRLAKAGVEVMDLVELKRKLQPGELDAPQRVDFFQLLLVESGEGVHAVDFVEHALHKGHVLLVKPGQVQEWRLQSNLCGMLVLVAPSSLRPSPGGNPGVNALLPWDDWPSLIQPSEQLFAHAWSDLNRVRGELENYDGSELQTAIAQHALVTVLLRLSLEMADVAEREGGSRNQALYRLFAIQLNALYMRRMSVLEHAQRLGYSESSLSRACMRTVGYTAKQVIDRRVALEAKRWLAHSKEPAAHIGHRLGFSEPTNFVKFFVRLCGETPQHFRQRIIGR